MCLLQVSWPLDVNGSIWPCLTILFGASFIKKSNTVIGGNQIKSLKGLTLHLWDTIINNCLSFLFIEKKNLLKWLP